MPVLRHIVEKFAQVGVSSISQGDGSENVPILRVLNLEGNPRTDVRLAGDEEWYEYNAAADPLSLKPVSTRYFPLACKRLSAMWAGTGKPARKQWPYS
jgi:hypothetical protein